MSTYLPPRLHLLPLYPYTTLFRSNNAVNKSGQLLDSDALFEFRHRLSPHLAHRNVTQHAERGDDGTRSEEHTSELQSRLHLVCRLQLEKKKCVRTHHIFNVYS